MNIIQRVKNILITPKTEWDVINGETATPMSLLTSYVMILAIIPAGCSFLAGVIFGWAFSLQYYLIGAVITYILSILSYFVFTYALDLLATAFGSEKNINKSAQVAAYSCTASYIAGILNIIPILGSLASIAGFIYSAYIMYLGVGPLKKTLEDKKVVYIIVVIVIAIAVFFIVGAILSSILLAGFFSRAAIRF